MSEDLADFLSQHAKPYDPATDDYRRPPFAQAVKAGKNSPIYNAHSYHTKVPPEGIVPYIKHYTDPGDLVLDPFCGSGMTGVACLMTGRNAILNDLSPAAAHIARNYTTPLEISAIKDEFERIKSAVKDEFEWLYGTTCDRCGGAATIYYVVWSDVFECGRCGNELILWDLAVDKITGKVQEKFTCPTCGAIWRKVQVKWLKSIPVITHYECPKCKPSRDQHATTDKEKLRIAEIEATPIPYWYPTTPFDSTWEMWRKVHGDMGITNISKFYTKRNLWAIAKLWYESNHASTERLAQVIKFVITSTNRRNSARTAWHTLRFGQASMTGTLYVPALTVENNLLTLVCEKLRQIINGLKSIKFGFSETIVQVRSATSLQIPDESVDYVFTDPPFGSNIFYADCNLIWESWLNEGLTDQSQEAVVHVKHKDKNVLPDYARLMEDAFREMQRVLKPGRWASVVFHNSDDRIWQTILDAAEKAGFELAEINAFDKGQLSFKGIRGAKGLERVTNKDIVLNLRKPCLQETARPNGRTHLAEAEQRVIETVADFLATNPPPSERTLQHIWNHVLYDMIRNGSVQVSMAGLDEMLAYHYQTFKVVDGKYYLRGEAVAGGNVFDLRTDAGAIAWLTSVLSNESQTTGELIPKWQRETAHLDAMDAGRLDRTLEQNFWQDKKTGRWRIPTAAEREKMSAREDLGAQAHLRVVRRYLEGNMDRQPDDRELVAWVRFCYNRGFYPETAALFEHITSERLDPEEYKTIKKMAAAARMKGSSA